MGPPTIFAVRGVCLSVRRRTRPKKEHETSNAVSKGPTSLTQSFLASLFALLYNPQPLENIVMKSALTLSFAVTIATFAAFPDVSAFGCKPDEVKGWMTSCDSVVNISQIKCDNKQCHTALHRLVEQEAIDCYVESGLGPASDLAKYKTLDDFCHGESPDPTELNAESSAQPKANQTTTETGSESGDANASVVKDDTAATVPATTSAAVSSPSLSPSSAGNNMAVASIAVFYVTIALSLMTTL